MAATATRSNGTALPYLSVADVRAIVADALRRPKSLPTVAAEQPAAVDLSTIRQLAQGVAEATAAAAVRDALENLPAPKATAATDPTIDRLKETAATAVAEVQRLGDLLETTRRELADVAALAVNRPTATATATAGLAAEEVKDLIRAALKVYRPKMAVAPQTIEVKVGESAARPIQGKAHAALPRVVRLAAARLNVMLVGPAGTGKTHLARQVSEALALPFAMISCSAGMSEGQLLGRLVPTGEGGRFEYLRSEFVRLYEEGGVFLMDELDAADSNTLLVINSALANGHMSVPNRPAQPHATRHADFCFIAAANTFGTGADRQYVGRNQLDEATLDRFRVGQVEMDYDSDLEAALCPDAELRVTLQEYRRCVRAAKLRRIISTRCLRDAYLSKLAGIPWQETEQSICAGWSADEIAKVKGGLI